MPGVSRDVDILRRMIAQNGDAAVNNGNSTGTSTVPIPINTSLPYILVSWGSLTGGSDAARIAGIHANGTPINASRTGTTGNDNVRWFLIGVPL